jgi:hypothetical protein
VAAAAGQQIRLGQGIEACRDDHQGLDTPLAALFGYALDRFRPHRDHGQVHLRRQCRRRPHAGDVFEFLGQRVDRIYPPGVTTGDDVVQDRPAGCPWVAAGPDHGHRFRREHVPQAGHVGLPFPIGHRLEIGFPARIGDVAGQVEGQLDDTVRPCAPGQQAGISEDFQHRSVLGQDIGGEGPHPLLVSSRHEVLEQQRRYPAVVSMIGDGHRDLRRDRRLRALVASDAH